MVSKGFIVLFLLAAIFCSPASCADFTGTPDTYTITINKVEFYNSTTSNWVTAGSGAMSFNIASVTAGATVGGYISGSAMPVGTYTKVRVTLSRTMYIQGSASTGGTTYYTTTSQQDVGTGGEAVKADTTAPAELGTMVVPTDNLPSNLAVSGGNFIATSTLTTPFVVKKGLSKKTTIKFDVTNKLNFNNDAPQVIAWPLPPTVSTTIQ